MYGRSSFVRRRVEENARGRNSTLQVSFGAVDAVIGTSDNDGDAVGNIEGKPCRRNPALQATFLS